MYINYNQTIGITIDSCKSVIYLGLHTIIESEALYSYSFAEASVKWLILMIMIPKQGFSWLILNANKSPLITFYVIH